MDGERFDALVKRFGSTRLTRVSVIRGIAASALAAVTGARLGAGETVEAQAGTCRALGQLCEGGGQACCAGLVCNGLENPTRCRECGAPGQFCCVGLTPCQGQNVCLPSGTCGPPAQCGLQDQNCCQPNNTCAAGLVCQNGTCQPGAGCGAQGQGCCPGGVCGTGLTCQNGTCLPAPGCGAQGEACCQGSACNTGLSCQGGTCQVAAQPPPSQSLAFSCTSNAECAARSSTAPFCDTATGQCFGIRGLNCKSGETPQQCCNRSVKKGCKRKQQTQHAKKNCLKKGKKRCKQLLAGVV